MPKPMSESQRRRVQRDQETRMRREQDALQRTLETAQPIEDTETLSAAVSELRTAIGAVRPRKRQKEDMQ